MAFEVATRLDRAAIVKQSFVNNSWVYGTRPDVVLTRILCLSITQDTLPFDDVKKNGKNACKHQK